MTKKVLNFENSFGYAVGRTFRALCNHFNRHLEAAGFDVTCEQFAVLHQLAVADGQTQRQLTESTNKDKTTITRSIDGLEKRGLVKRVPVELDGRQKKVFLTAKGKKFQDKLFRLMDKAVASSQKNIKQTDLTFCKQVLDKIYQNITKSS